MTEAQRLADHLERVWCDKESAAELRRLEAECEQLRADAGRYGYLRSHPERVSVAVVVQGHWLPAIGEQLDAAIAKATEETK